MRKLTNCDECPAHRLASDHLRRKYKAQRAGMAFDFEPDEMAAASKGGGLEAFRRVGRELAKKLSATDWMDLRNALLEEGTGAADDLPVSGATGPGGLPMNQLESQRLGAAMDAARHAADASFYEMYPEARDHTVRSIPGDPLLGYPTITFDPFREPRN